MQNPYIIPRFLVKDIIFHLFLLHVKPYLKSVHSKVYYFAVKKE